MALGGTIGHLFGTFTAPQVAESDRIATVLAAATLLLHCTKGKPEGDERAPFLPHRPSYVILGDYSKRRPSPFPRDRPLESDL